MSHQSCAFWMKVASLCLAFTSAGTARADWTRIRIFADENFKGAESVYIGPRTVMSTAAAPVRSAHVLSGRWLLCDTNGLSGNCAWLSGNVKSLTAIGFTTPLVSLKSEVVPLIKRDWGDRRPPSRSSIVFFRDKNYTGEWFAIQDNVADMASIDTAFAPGSVVVQDGVWRLCTEPESKGRCLSMTSSSWDLADIFTTQIRSVERLQ